MVLTLSWSTEGEVQLARRLRGVSESLRDWTPAFRDTAFELKKTFSDDVFATEGSAIGEHWQPLSPSYAAQKGRKYPGKGILEATGKMKNSFVSTFSADQAAITNTAPYFKYHQSRQPRFKIPRRVMMKLDHSAGLALKQDGHAPADVGGTDGHVKIPANGSRGTARHPSLICRLP